MVRRERAGHNVFSTARSRHKVSSPPDMISANPGSSPQQRAGSLRWRMSATVLALSLLLVLIIEFFHLGQNEESWHELLSPSLVSALVRDLVFGVMLAVMIVWLLDRFTL